MANEQLLPAHLRNVPHLAAFETIWEDRVEGIDLSALMMYVIDSVSTKALPYLADQFGIITLRSWKLAADDDARRVLIKEAIATRSSMGTVAAVKKAIASLGFDPTHLIERCGSDPDTGWACFKLAFDATELSILDGDLMDLLTQLINDTKPARCLYVGLEYNQEPIVDVITETDTITLGVGVDTIQDTFNTQGLKFDGSWIFDGSKKCHPGVESVLFTVGP